MKNFLSNGDVLTLTAPAGGVVGGVAVKIGSAIVVPVASADAGEKFAGKVTGEYQLAAQNDAAWAEGDLLYFTAGAFTKVAAGGVKAGYATAAKVLADAFGAVRLTPTL